MGANDVCTSSRATMRSVTDFRSQFAAAMSTLASGLPSGKHVFVSSIANVYRLWQILHGNTTAQLIWTAGGICQSMLSPLNAEADRQAVLAREEAFNRVLADVCSQYTFCRFRQLRRFRLPVLDKPSQQARLLPPESGRASGARFRYVAAGPGGRRSRPRLGRALAHAPYREK